MKMKQLMRKPDRPTVKQMKSRPLTREQAAVCEATVNQYNQVCNSVAGSGKTTTAIEAVKQSGRQALYLAFNVHNAQDIQQKIGSSGDASTWNRFGLASLNSLNRREVRGGEDGTGLSKYEELVMKLGVQKWAQRPVLKLCELWRCTWTDTAVDPQRIQTLAEMYGVHYTPGTLAYCVDPVRSLLEAGVDCDWMVDFTDQLWLCAREADKLEFRIPRTAITADLIVMDEAQDNNRIQLEIARRILESGTQVLAIGDEHQAIYQFRGSTTGSMDALSTAMFAYERDDYCRSELTVTFRSPRVSSYLAQEIVPKIRSWKGAAEGTVSVLEDGEREDIKPGSMVLSRTNAPLIGMAFELMQAGKKVHVRGREFGSKLCGTVKTLLANHRPSSMTGYYQALAGWHRAAIQPLEQLGDLAFERRAVIDEQLACLVRFGQAVETPEKVETRIRALFSDEVKPGCVTLSTIHRGKGLEAENVYLLEPQKLGIGKLARDGTPMESSVEENLLYIAVTRNTKNLYFCGGVPPVLAKRVGDIGRQKHSKGKRK